MEGSLEVILPTIWTDEKQRWEELEKRREEKRREEERRSKKRKPQKKDDPGARKSRKVAKPCMCLSNDLWASWPDERWKSARRCGSKHMSKSKCTKHASLGQLLEVEMMKNCRPLWREARFEVKMYKTHHVRTTFGSWDDEKVHIVVARSTCRSQHVQNTPCSDYTFGSWDVEKVHAVVAQSTFRSQNVQSTSASDRFWKLRCRKSARRCGTKHISKSKCTKHSSLGALLEVAMYKTRHVRTTLGSCDVEKVHAVVARSTFRSQNVKNTTCLGNFWTFSKVSKTWTVCSISKNHGRRGAFEEDLQRCIFRDRRSTRHMFIRAVTVGGPGADFLRGVAFWSIRSSGFPRWFCVTGAALRMTPYHFFVAGAVLQTGGLEKSQNALVRGRQLCTQLSMFGGSLSLAELLRFWCCQLKKIRKSRRIASFFDVVNLKKWGYLADMLRFWCCQVQTLRTSRRIASFPSLQIER